MPNSGFEVEILKHAYPPFVPGTVLPALPGLGLALALAFTLQVLFFLFALRIAVRLSLALAGL